LEQQARRESKNVRVGLKVALHNKMQTFDYIIDKDHLVVTCGNQTSWHYIGGLQGINATVIENTVAAPANVTLTLRFPGLDPVIFLVTCPTATEAVRVIAKANSLVKDLIQRG
jgi:sortase (surface protein transpeptidase)